MFEMIVIKLNGSRLVLRQGFIKEFDFQLMFNTSPWGYLLDKDTGNKVPT